MQLRNKIFAFFGALTMVLGGVGLYHALTNKGEAIEPDNIEYQANKHAVLSRPDIKADEDDEIPEVKKVILHYHNDDGKCGHDVTSPGTAGGRAFYIWAAGVKGYEYMPDEVANDGQDMVLTIDYSSDKYSIYAGKTSLMFIIKYRQESLANENWPGQSSDTELSFYEFKPDENGQVEVWTMHASGSDIKIYRTEAETKVTGIKTAEFINWKTIKCFSNAESYKYWVYALDETYYKRDVELRDNYKDLYLIMSGTAQGQDLEIVLPHLAHINLVYMIESLDDESVTGLHKTATATFDKLYDTKRFNQYYTYDGNDLGCTYTTNATTFKVWAPTAANMTVNIYDHGATADYGGKNFYKGYHMHYTGKGVWELTIDGNLMNKFYTYKVENSSGSAECIDPYAKACGLNGVRACVVNWQYSNPSGWGSLPVRWDNNEEHPELDIETPQDLVIYEVHVQDFTADESWNGTQKPGTFKAFVEKGTHLKDDETISTGYDHLNELGVNAVQLLPVFDHDNDETTSDYNWGYNPLNYNCVEGAYSSDPSKALTRISEFKNLILQLSKTEAHTRVIMDVVFNHVSRASASSFTKLMPKYYFRYNAVTGEYENGSGCSNEVKTEAPMMRKFIVDSVCFWATEYKIKGFRFDLMGLIDSSTMRAVKDALYEIDPDIYVYGEGWTSIEGYHGPYNTSTDTARVYSELYPTEQSQGILGCFNDCGRDATRGGNDAGWGSGSSLPGYGLLQQGQDGLEPDPNTGDKDRDDYIRGQWNERAERRDKVAKMIWGANRDKGANPKQTINYISCHDNWTVRDQLYYTLGSNGVGPSTEQLLNTSVTAHALALFSNAATVMLGGEELFRTKELSDEAREEVQVTTYENMYGHYISHNSYNAPIETNSFKWGNKLEIDGVNTAKYTQAFIELVNLHKTLKKMPFHEDYYGHTSGGEKIDNISWYGYTLNGSKPTNGVAGFQYDDYFIFMAGREAGYVANDTTGWEQLFKFGEVKNGLGALELGKNGIGGAVAIYLKK